MNKALPNSNPFFFYFQAPEGVPTVNDGDFQKFMAEHYPRATELTEDMVEHWVSHLRVHEVSMVTCNPMLLNFLDDEVALTNVVVPTANGLALFGDIPALVSALSALGPGEAVADTALHMVTPLPSNILAVTPDSMDISPVE